MPTAHGLIYLSSQLILLYFRLGISLQACLLQIVGYRNLIADVEKLRREPYDSDNPQHEEMLLKVSPLLLSDNGCQAFRPALHLCTVGTKMSKRWVRQQMGRSEFSS